MMAAIHARLETLSRWLVWAGGAALMVAAIIVTIDVLCRKFVGITMSVSTPVKFNDKVKIGDENVMTALGTILSTTNITLLSDIDSAGNLGINDGDPGQVKFVIMTSNAGGHTITLQGANLQNDISFSAAGDTATLLYTNSKWYFIGGTATVS